MLRWQVFVPTLCQREPLTQQGKEEALEKLGHTHELLWFYPIYIYAFLLLVPLPPFAVHEYWRLVPSQGLPKEVFEHLPSYRSY
jgi:hypothetical protein